MGPTTAYITTAVTAAAASAAAALVSENNAEQSEDDAADSAAASAASAVVAASYFGSGAIADTSFTIANNQSSSADVTGLSFNGALMRSAEFIAHFYRNTTGVGATELCAVVRYFCAYKTVAASWDITPIGISGDVDSSTGAPAGVTLSITSAGQVQYTSTNITGTAASSVMHFRANTLAV